jgi:phytanoyl-CoA hydroxylase
MTDGPLASLYHYTVPTDGIPSSETLETFRRDGVVVLKQFCTPEEVAGMKGRMGELIDKWDPAEAKGSVFHTYGNEKLNQDYFLESAATIKFFLEADAVDRETGGIKPEIPKGNIINKVGHALHFLDPIFREYSQSQKVKSLVKSLGYKDPVLPQSMYIFKQGLIGGEVTSHQDSTYLFTTPHQTCLGLWLALDDATVENGCLWARKGSHHEPIRSQLVRTDRTGTR